jgi:hypothetical protein
MALLPWSVARDVWVAALGLLILACALCSVWLCGRSIWSAQGLLAVGLILALAPVQTGLAKGNVSIAAAAVGLIGVLLMRRHADVTGGVLLGIGLSLKPEVAIGFVAFAVVIRRWRAVVVAIAVAALCWSIGALTLENNVPGWTTTWTDSVARSMASGAINDASPANANRDQVITLVRLLTDFMPNVGLAQVVAVVALSGIGVLVAVSAWRADGSWEGSSIVWPVSALLVLSLLPIYHRFYDATLLALPVAAVVANTAYLEPRIRAAMAVALAVFFVPGGAMLLVADERGWIPATIQHSPLWISGVRAHDVWALCLLAILLSIVTLRIASTHLTSPRLAAGLP